MVAEGKEIMDDRRTITTGYEPAEDEDGPNPLEGMAPDELADAMLDDYWMEQFGEYITPEMRAAAKRAREQMDELKAVK